MPKMHEDEIEMDLREVKEMVANQFPRLAHLPIKKIESFGTVNTIYQLGASYSVRVPKIISGVTQIEKEEKWLPFLARKLPLAIPNLIEVGNCSDSYPWKWAIYEWIGGETARRTVLGEMSANISILAAFIKALQNIETEERLTPGEHNYFRGEPLINRDDKTRATLFKLRDEINYDIGIKVWKEAIEVPLREEEKKWIHGDLQSGNILVRDGLITSIIDFGALGFGDMACDLLPAWNLLNSRERAAFKDKMSVSETVWKRGMGWALTVSVVALEYYKVTNPALSAISRYTLNEIEKAYRCY